MKDLHIKKKILFLESELFYSNIIDTRSNQFLEFCFDGGLRCKALNLNQYDLVVYTIYSSFLFNFIISKCDLLRVPTLLLFDGVAEFSNFYNNPNISSLGIKNYHPIISDYLAVVGDRTKKYFEQYGCDVITYLPKHMSSDFNMKIPDEKCFLITTANTAYYNDDEYGLLLTLIKNVVVELKFLSIPFKFRIFDQRLLDDLDIASNENIISGRFDDVISGFSCVITTPSSISLSAMNAGRAVAHLIYRDYPHFFQTGWSIFPGIGCRSTLESMISMDVERLVFQASEVNAHFHVDQLHQSLANMEFQKKCQLDRNKFQEHMFFKMLNSRFNINVEYLFRSIYWKVKFNFSKVIANRLRHFVFKK